MWKKWLSGNSMFITVFLLTILNFSNVQAGQDLVGYDENTEVIVTGTIIKTEGCEFRGLKCFVMESNSRTFNVITAPFWFVKRIHLNLKPRQSVRVVGSKFYGADGGRYIVARSLKTLPNGRFITFRDNKCRPVWNTRTIKRSSCMKIFYTPSQSL